MKSSLFTAGILMGVGMGGFVDGIVFHQILQYHSMLSGKLPQDDIVNIKTSMVWDGFFHMVTWITTAISIKLLWNCARDHDKQWSGVAYTGALFLGWGLFNFIEGLINHHILRLHHVVERLGLSVYDYLFLVAGAAFILLGITLIRSGAAHHSLSGTADIHVRN